MTDDDFWDDLFMDCAFAVFVEQVIEQRGAPDVEATRRRAFRLLQRGAAARNRCGR
jgi:hypothetical protein